MENLANMLDHLQAALDIADADDEHLIGAHLSMSMQILQHRLGGIDPSESTAEPSS